MNEFEQLIETDKKIDALIAEHNVLFKECFIHIYTATSGGESYSEKARKATEFKAKYTYKRCEVGEYYQTKYQIYKRIK